MRNSLIREMSFKANFLLWSLVEVLWFLGQILFIEVLFSHVQHIGDWNKWQVVALIGTHQVIAQLFQAFFYMNLTHLPELVRTGKLDVLLTLPIDSQFAISTKQFGLDNLLNTFVGLALVSYALYQLDLTPSVLQVLLYFVSVVIGITVHYSVMFGLSTLCFWIIRAQGLVFAYFNLFNVGRYPDSVFKGTFRAIFSWVIPVILVANVPAHMIVEPLQSPSHALALLGQLTVSAGAIAIFTRLLWHRALQRYSSASS
ncbi:MAG: ABC-2 family transporter protein [Verrucomicrobiota bacterium]